MRKIASLAAALRRPRQPRRHGATVRAERQAMQEGPAKDLNFFRKPIAAADDLDMAPPQAAAPSRDAPNDYRGAQPHEFSDGRQATWDQAERADYEDSHDLIEDGSAPMHGLEQAYALDDEQRIQPGRPPARRPIEPADHYREPRAPRSYRGLAQLVAALVILLGVCTVVYWQWSNINNVYQFLSHFRSLPSQTPQPPPG